MATSGTSEAAAQPHGPLDIRGLFGFRGSVAFLALGFYQMWSVFSRLMINQPYRYYALPPAMCYASFHTAEALAAVAIGLVFLIRRLPPSARLPRIPWPAALLLGCIPLVSSLGLLAGSAPLSAAALAAYGAFQTWCYAECVGMYCMLDRRSAVCYVLVSFSGAALLRMPFELLPLTLSSAVAAPLPLACLACVQKGRAIAAARLSEAGGAGGRGKGPGAVTALPVEREGLSPYVVAVGILGTVLGSMWTGIQSTSFSGAGLFAMYAIQVAVPLALLAVLLLSRESINVAYSFQLAVALLLVTVIEVAGGMEGQAAGVASYLSRYFFRMLFIVVVVMLNERGERQPLAMFGLGYGALIGSLAAGIFLSQTPSFESFMGDRAVLITLMLCLVVALVIVSSVDMVKSGSRLLFSSPATTPDVISQEKAITERCDELAESHGLTSRERDVMRLIALGRSKGYIAEELLISENTVKGYARTLYKKLGIHSKQDLLDLVMGKAG